MPEERLIYLVDRYLNRSCSNDERAELEDYGTQHPEVWHLIHRLEDQEQIEKDLHGWQDPRTIAFPSTPVHKKYPLLHTTLWKRAAILLGPILLLWIAVSVFRRPDAKTAALVKTGNWQFRSTPRNGTLNLTLPDGTQVWLNSSSTLRYPTVFTDSIREVTVTGEAYLDVKHDPVHPFNIRAKDCRIEVLGTQIDVMAYPDENQIQTTLLKGSVAIHHAKKRQLLQPGQQLIVPPHDNWQLIAGIDTNAILSWKNGYFYFKHTPAREAFRQLSRWYGIPIETKGPMKRNFTATLKTDLPLPLILKQLGLSATYEKNRIIVSE